MTFTAPALLWALPLALVPLLLHLLSRRRARLVEFSDLTLLRRVSAEALPRARLRQWLLAALRCGLVLALVLAYAGPVLKARGGGPLAAVPGGQASSAPEGGAGPGLDLVLLLDCSYSMGVVDQGRTRWAAARAAAEDVLRSLRPSDRVACAAFSDRIEGGAGRPAWMTPRECQEIFGRSPPGSQGTDYAAALRPAYELLAAVPRRDRAVLLLSDGAAHGLSGGLPPPEPGVALYGLSWPRAPFNAAALAAGPARESSPDKPALRVALWASARADSALDLWRDRARLAVSAAALRAGEETSLPLPLPPAGAGIARPAWSGRVELRPDALAADDAFYYSFRHPRRPRLLVLYGDPAFLKAPQGGYFLKELFAQGKGRLLEWDADFAGLERISSGGGQGPAVPGGQASSAPGGGDAPGARLSDYDAAALADFQSLPAPAAAALELFVRRGGGLWLMAGGRAAAADFAPLAAWLPARLGPAAPSGAARGLRVEKPAEPFALWRDFELDKVAAARRLELKPRPGASVWLRAASGEPLLVSGAHGEGRVAVWAAALDAGSGNLPVKPVFAALVSASLALLRQPAARAEVFAAKAGEPIVRAWGPKEAAPLSVRVRSPEGRTTSLWVKERRVEYGLTQRPGLYLMEDDAGGSRVYAVNLDRGAGESDLSPAASPPWQGLSAGNLREEFWLKVRGQDMRTAALAAAVAFVLCEMILSLPRVFLVLLLLAAPAAPLAAQEGGRFVWTQLKLGPGWDPYPDAPAQILELLSTVTSVLVHPERRVVAPQDPALFASPLVVLAGREAPPPLAAADGRRLRAYLDAGGMLWIEDTSGSPSGSFDRWVRRTLKDLLPESELRALEADHVVFKAFFFLRGVAGRVLVRGTLEGVAWGGRTAVVYSRNDILGAWIKDPLGRPLLPCLPGGEAQRHNARKLGLNIIMYSLTGSYKSDAVHQPYLLQKMRSGLP